MIGATIEDANNAFLLTLAEQHKRGSRIKLVDCPYPIYEWHPDDGKTREVKYECQYGPGAWCKICKRHTAYQKQRGESKQRYETNKRDRLRNRAKVGLTVTRYVPKDVNLREVKSFYKR